MPPLTRSASKEQSVPKGTFARDLKSLQQSAAPEKGKAKAKEKEKEEVKSKPETASIAMTNARAPSSQPLVVATPRASSANPQSLNKSDVIVIDDSDDERPPPPKKRRALAPTKSRVVGKLDDVVEISSSDEGSSAKRKDDMIKDLQEQIKTLKKTNMQLQHQVDLERQEKGRRDAKIAQLTADIATMKKKKKNDALPELEDHSTCEICVMRMWSPYTLPSCGHTFCQSCLSDWFSSILAKHMTDHPNYHAEFNLNLPANLLARPEVQAQIAALRGPEPAYSCPACRAAVKGRPVEVYALKKMCQTVGRTMGEGSPKRVLPPRGAGHGEGPWDGFFPVR